MARTRVIPGSLGALAAAFVLATGNAAAATSGPTLLGSADFRVFNDRAVQVQVTVNGHPATMNLTLQSIASIVRGNYVTPLGLTARTSTHWTAKLGDIEMTQFARLVGFSIGSMKIDDPAVYVLPDAAPAEVTGTPSIGMLGIDQLGNFDFELDFANNKLNFYSPNHWHRQVVYWTDKYSSAPLTRTHFGGFVFPVELSGKRVEAVIATSGAHSAIHLNAFEAIYGALTTFDDVQTETGSKGESDRYRFMTLSGLGVSNQKVRFNLDPTAIDPSCALTTENTRAYYYQGERCRGGEAPVDLGLDVIRRLHLYFAVKDQIVYFSEATAH